ncbi:SRPBCC family protein [Pedobacter africanus]|uniref:Uncharacterized conserved protein YndB, AHSA1/START domain n=1 Tax=Pedobacter africanus TaxID=151894 RepID=A0A1W2DWI5_9SPHI|nr:SRPBCC family protein [Pedobacter africanus]SMD01814.1 Uncharacterized conserved protein YndB, AHSA1/START domain [Pedobacter africanus]
MNNYGKLIAPGVIRFERNLPGPIEKVWAYLTQSEKRGKWLAKGEMELFEGGKVELCFVHSELSPLPDVVPEKYKDMDPCHQQTDTMLKVDVPHLLAFTWGSSSAVTFELSEAENGRVNLVITHRNLSNATELISTASGWHNHLEILLASLEGTTPQPFWKRHTELEDAYSKILVP